MNLFIGLMSFGSWIFMAVLTRKGDMLASNGFGSLKYFTVLSNLFNGAVCLLYACWLIRGKEMTPAKKLLKLMGTTAVGLTFITVMGFLGPLYGYNTMFNGGNFWMHLVLPLLSFVSYIFYEREVKIPLRLVHWTVLPTLLYEIGYVMNMVLNGVGTWPDTNDFYAFLSWGYAMGAVIAAVILGVTELIALVLWKAGRRK